LKTRKITSIFLCSIGFSLFFGLRVFAAPPDDWSLESTVAAATTIAVVQCSRVTRVENTDFFPQQLGKYLVYARVKAILRGEPAKLIRIWHYQPLPGTDRLGNGPSYLYFSDEVKRIASSLAVGASSSEFDDGAHTLLYLKQAGDGVFEPASGRMFAGHSAVNHDDLDLVLERERSNGKEASQGNRTFKNK
jgi:hypothetical protein